MPEPMLINLSRTVNYITTLGKDYVIQFCKRNCMLYSVFLSSILVYSVPSTCMVLLNVVVYYYMGKRLTDLCR